MSIWQPGGWSLSTGSNLLLWLRQALLLLALALVLGSCANTTTGNLVILPEKTEQGPPPTVGFHLPPSGRAEVPAAVGSLFLCVREDREVRLSSIEALESEGDVQVVGAYIRTGAGSALGAAWGDPPSVPPSSAGFVAIDGFQVQAPCETSSGGLAEASHPELVVVAARTSNAGGVIKTFRLWYEDDSHLLSTDYGGLHIWLAPVGDG